MPDRWLARLPGLAPSHASHYRRSHLEHTRGASAARDGTGGSRGMLGSEVFPPPLSPGDGRRDELQQPRCRGTSEPTGLRRRRRRPPARVSVTSSACGGGCSKPLARGSRGGGAAVRVRKRRRGRGKRRAAGGGGHEAASGRWQRGFTKTPPWGGDTEAR